MEWHECYDSFQCARLAVPLDYWNGTEGTAILAIIKLPAKVPISDPRYGGPILFNPGGPGVSGTSAALSSGPGFQRMFDTLEDPSLTKGNENARYYDIVGFDPRGIGYSLPSATCFETDMQRAEWNLRMAAAGILGSSNYAVADEWGRRRAYGLACYHLTQSKSPADNIMPFITTASTARDMITIVDRYGEWREAEAQRTLNGQVPENLRYKEGEERVQYYGLSWGTFLGQTFASMFPERTGRYILDAVVDTDDYIHALWTVSVFDSEKAMDWFYSSCAQAGPKNCALAKPDSNANDIRVRLKNILNNLYQHPVISTGKIPDLLTWSDVMGIVMQDAYQPKMWANLATTMAALEDVLSSPLGNASAATYYPVCGNIPALFQYFDAESGITCGDAFPSDGNYTLQDAQAHWEHLYQLSPTLAATFAPLNFTCAAWLGRAMYSYRGPFGSSSNSSVPPMLFIANTVDPVTPIYSARKMVQRFSGARLLTLNMPGHSSMAWPSACMMRHARAYMQNGTLPDEGFVCEVNVNATLFHNPNPDLQSRNNLTDLSISAEAEDRALIAAHGDASEFFIKHRIGLG